jgi:hypothetical protein
VKHPYPLFNLCLPESCIDTNQFHCSSNEVSGKQSCSRNYHIDVEIAHNKDGGTKILVYLRTKDVLGKQNGFRNALNSKSKTESTISDKETESNVYDITLQISSRKIFEGGSLPAPSAGS